MKSKKIIIGSRGSKLALLYAQNVKNAFIKNTDFSDSEIIIKIITTEGDQVKDVRLSDLGGKGLFSTRIEKELIEKKIDIAVHALKDMPALETKGLKTDCFLKRNDPREILISNNIESKVWETYIPSQSETSCISFLRSFTRFSFLIILILFH